MTNQIEFKEKKIDVIQVHANLEQIIDTNLEGINFDPNLMVIPVISDMVVEEIDLSSRETLFTGYHDMLQKMMSIKGFWPN